MSDRDVPEAILDRLRATCLSLPEAYEELAWVGVRWRVRTKTFAHVLMIHDGWPPSYARTFATTGPACVLTFEATGDDLAVLSALAKAGPRFVRPSWRPTVVGLVLDHQQGEEPDWAEIAELLTDSYRALAPKRLVRQLEGQ